MKALAVGIKIFDEILEIANFVLKMDLVLIHVLH